MKIGFGQELIDKGRVLTENREQGSYLCRKGIRLVQQCSELSRQQGEGIVERLIRHHLAGGGLRQCGEVLRLLLEGYQSSLVEHLAATEVTGLDRLLQQRHKLLVVRGAERGLVVTENLHWSGLRRRWRRR